MRGGVVGKAKFSASQVHEGRCKKCLQNTFTLHGCADDSVVRQAAPNPIPKIKGERIWELSSLTCVGVYCMPGQALEKYLQHHQKCSRSYYPLQQDNSYSCMEKYLLPLTKEHPLCLALF